MIVLIRALAILVGLATIAAVGHGTVMSTGGYSIENNAPLYIALAAVQAVLALSLGVIHRRGFLATANLQLSALETHAAPIHEAEAKRRAAEVLVARLDRDDRVERAELALREARTDATAKSTAPGCGQNCRATLAKSVDDATSAVDAARQSLQLEQRQARAALDKAPIPGSATPLADRTGWQAWVIDLSLVGLRGFGLSLGAALCLAIGAHTRREANPVKPPIKLGGNVVAIAPRARLPVKIGDVDAFLLDHVAPEQGARVSWAELFIRYRTWCEAKSSTPIAADAFGARLDALRTELGLRTRTKGKDVFFVDLKLAS
jgi:hypothetical protein